MKYKLLLKAEAIKDIMDAFDWYENERTGLGVEFLDQLEDSCNQILQSPNRYQAYRNQRIAIVHRFPYKIVFEIEAGIIVVYAVYHDKRNPEKLAERE